ncbi:MAG: MBL fold metallo-hydrolase [Rhodobacterales bacterium]|jgi:glyoxylase-like metal-dependent hydrolase (beta-lactamase superfamily II)|nr:MBL fold metallo-hydrolase [Pseudomonadota bacterium]MDA1285833.1 MBL fold metallo-hydrolase [Pseudomonadota bacterium]NQW14111.1 MBL fold metallo-hydrolase [Rhodobacter sp.]
MRNQILGLLFTLFAAPVFAQLATVEIAPDIYALVGPKTQRGPGNLGNNATFGFVVTPDGVVLIDAGGSLRGAEKIDVAIAAVTDQPVRIVINTGGQDHRWFGNAYWAAKGARTIASGAAIDDQNARGSLQMTVLTQLVGAAGMAGTVPQAAQEGFATDMALTFGGVEFALHFVDAAHTPGDAFVWLRASRTVFAGDIIFAERILGLTADSSSRGWLDSFAAIEALDPEHVVPGHGSPTDILTAAADTYDYIAQLRRQITAHIEAGGNIISAVDVDQSAFAYLENFDQLAKRNAQRVFEEIEFE